MTAVSLDDLDAACRWWATREDADYAQVGLRRVLKAARLGPEAAGHCAVLERAMPRPDQALLVELDRLAGAGVFRLVERDGSGRVFRVDEARFEVGDLAKREAMLRNGSRSWRPVAARWWDATGPDGWVR